MALKREDVIKCNPGAWCEERQLSGWFWIGMETSSKEPNGSCLPCTSHLMNLASIVVNIAFGAEGAEMVEEYQPPAPETRTGHTGQFIGVSELVLCPNNLKPIRSMRSGGNTRTPRQGEISSPTIRTA